MFTMIYAQPAHLLIGLLIVIYLSFFIYSSITEKRPRAILISTFMTLIFLVTWVALYYALEHSISGMLAPGIVMILLLVIFTLPVGKISAIKIIGKINRVDERDIMFAREDYEPGTAKYEIYYKTNPELKSIDDKIRELPRIVERGGRYFEPVYARYIHSIFESTRSYLKYVDGDISPEKTELNPSEASRLFKKYLYELGAVDVGIGPLNQAYVYSHVGRGPEEWGSPIVNNHKYAIMFAVEMRYEYVECAPKLPITHESAQQYLNAAMYSVPLAAMIRKLGYSARAHIAGSNYQIMMPPVAHDAGLGELGRIGYLISPRFGARFRLGGITTDMPLEVDKPISFGVQEFCEKCEKCAINCPSGAIPKGEKTIVRGVEKWQLDIERCMRFWRICGTDCGLCMKTCPYSHPQSFAHNVVRTAVKRSPLAQYISIWADDIVYGKKEKLAKIQIKR